jgi:polyketide biosynthesis acyl carrier protein
MEKEAIFELITRNAREVIPRLKDHSFQPADSLRALGANSIDRSEIVMMTLEEMVLDIPLAETLKAENIGELAALLHAKRQAVSV